MGRVKNLQAATTGVTKKTVSYIILHNILCVALFDVFDDSE